MIYGMNGNGWGSIGVSDGGESHGGDPYAWGGMGLVQMVKPYPSTSMICGVSIFLVRYRPTIFLRRYNPTEISSPVMVA